MNKTLVTLVLVMMFSSGAVSAQELILRRAGHDRRH